jgi:hypothetical protein
MRHYFIMFVSIVIILILVLSILFQQAQWYHNIIAEARKFANNRYFQKNYGKRSMDFLNRFIGVFEHL